MFHRIKCISALPNHKLRVQFANGTEKLYDMAPLFTKISEFTKLKDDSTKFYSVKIDTGGYGITWDEELDLSSDELWENGILVE